MGCAPSTKPTKNGICPCKCHKNDARSSKPPLKSKTSNLEELQLADFKDDPRLPITGRQVYLLQKSWKAVARNMTSTGINMFLSLFEKNGEAKNYFGKLRSTATLTELRSSGALEAHAKTVMMTIDESIMAMNDVDTLIGMLQHIVNSHLGVLHADPQVFWLIREPFILAIKEVLGDRYSAHIADIYWKAITFILAILVDGYDQGRQVRENGNDIKSTDDRPD